MYTTVLSSITSMSTRTQTYTMAGAGAEAAVNGSVNVLARDQLPVSLDVSVMFHLNGHDAITVYRNFGANYDDQIVHPLVRTAVRDAASEFSAVDLIDHRAELQTRMTSLVRTALASTLHGRGAPETAVVIDNVLLRNIDLPASIDEAIANVQRQRQATAERTQANLTAQQEAARVLTVANGENAARVATVEAEARMTRIRSEAQAHANQVLSASLTPAFLQYERIQATRAVLASNGTRTVFIPGNTGPSLLMNAQ
jgi:regulator of protease activity HflC (stomatin/prohibitin superfamily)